MQSVKDQDGYAHVSGGKKSDNKMFLLLLRGEINFAIPVL